MGRVLWFTGLSGAGKTTLATSVYGALQAQGTPCCLLDGDTLRAGLCSDLTFTPRDRRENIRRVAEIAKLLANLNFIVLVALISPRRDDRERARSIIGKQRFLEIFVDTPLEECARRDPKGLYKKAFSGEIPYFTGISDVYEAPESPCVRIQTIRNSIEECRQMVFNACKE